MLREIHHRVKNNLQVITSLLRLQSKDIDDPEVIKQFSEATNRVIAMSLIHEKIYQTKNLSDIDISSYFETLTKELIRSYTLAIPIETNIIANIEAITTDHMVPLALLLNELTSNSLKHGFRDKEIGKINISLTEINNEMHLTYSDNGHWNLSEKKFSFGLELIDTLTEQLDGHYERTTEDGTHYKFVFPKEYL
jgi:two-component sensor histidine kinase